MKKTLISTAFIFLVAATISKTQSDRPSDIILNNIEALASGESVYDYSQPKTVSCDYIEGSWHTGSVRRACVFCAVPYSCTETECGEIFYN